MQQSPQKLMLLGVALFLFSIKLKSFFGKYHVLVFITGAIVFLYAIIVYIIQRKRML